MEAGKSGIPDHVRDDGQSQAADLLKIPRF
jgi:hypothetical protein